MKIRYITPIPVSSQASRATPVGGSPSALADASSTAAAGVVSPRRADVVADVGRLAVRIDPAHELAYRQYRALGGQFGEKTIRKLGGWKGICVEAGVKCRAGGGQPTRRHRWQRSPNLALGRRLSRRDMELALSDLVDLKALAEVP